MNNAHAQLCSSPEWAEYIATEVLPVTHYRPGLAEYPQVSVALQEAVESVVTGASPEDAAADYQSALEGIVGADAVTGATS